MTFTLCRVCRMTEKVAEVKSEYINDIRRKKKKYQEIKSRAVVESYAKFRMHGFDESIRTGSIGIRIH